MEREILFKGKRINNGEWVYGLFCECPCNDGTDIPSIMRIESKGNHRIFMQYPIISETRGQYTGLTDKNGRRIFEGDIVKNIDGIYVVEYCKSLTRFALVHDGLMSGRPVSSGTVIGNIHDDPELLGGESK